MKILISTESYYPNISGSSEIIQQKSEAIDQYLSQLKVPILRSLMDSFIRKNEIFVKVAN